MIGTKEASRVERREQRLSSHGRVSGQSGVPDGKVGGVQGRIALMCGEAQQHIAKVHR